MDHVYHNYQRQAQQLERNLRPALNSNNYQSRQLGWELRELHNDFAVRKDPRAIEARMKGIQQHVGTMERTGRGLSAGHSATLHQNMSTMRLGMHNLPRYYKK
jgi:hypothetical protein